MRASVEAKIARRVQVILPRGAAAGVSGSEVNDDSGSLPSWQTVHSLLFANEQFLGVHKTLQCASDARAVGQAKRLIGWRCSIRRVVATDSGACWRGMLSRLILPNDRLVARSSFGPLSHGAITHRVRLQSDEISQRNSAVH